MSDLNSFHRKFKSGNSVEVHDARINRAEYEAVCARISELEKIIEAVGYTEIDLTVVGEK